MCRSNIHPGCVLAPQSGTLTFITTNESTVQPGAAGSAPEMFSGLTKQHPETRQRKKAPIQEESVWGEEISSSLELLTNGTLNF